jgi:hypothetical protein
MAVVSNLDAAEDMELGIDTLGFPLSSAPPQPFCAT